MARRDSSLAVPLGAVTVREWPLKPGDIREYRGKRARSQAAALEEFGFRSAYAEDDSNGTDDRQVKREETEGVFIIKDNYVKFMPVEIGIAGEDDFEVLSGLQADQKIVTGPFRILRELKDGALVKVDAKKGRQRSGD